MLITVHPVSLSNGMVIHRSLRAKPAVYNLNSASLDHPALTIRGDHITVDLKGATLRGTPANTPPDQRTGLAILVEGGRDVTIKNASIHGYKLAILARNCTGLKLLNCDWSYNWKQRLKSTPAKEDETDWMYFHHNEHDEWIHGNPDTGVSY